MSEGMVRKGLVKCLQCNNGFDPKRYWQKFCAPECRDKWHKRIKGLAMQEYLRKHHGRDNLA